MINRFRDLPKSFKIFLGISAVVYIATLLTCGIAHMVGARWEYRYFYFHHPLGSTEFEDLTLYQQRFQLFHTSAFFGAGRDRFYYPAALALFYKALFLTGNALIVMFVYIGVVIVGAASFMVAALRRRGVSKQIASLFMALAVIFSYPLLFEVQRCNVEIFLWTATVLAVYFLYTGKDSAAAIMIGAAASMKLFPILLLGIFLIQKKYWKVLLGAATFAAGNLLSFAILGPTVIEAYRSTSLGVQDFVTQYGASINLIELPFDHSLFAFFKVLYEHSSHLHRLDLQHWITAYSIFVITATLIILFRVLPRLPLVNQIAALLTISVLFPLVSYHYTLLTIHIVWALVVLSVLDAYRQGNTLTGANQYMAALALALVPEGFIIVFQQRCDGAFKALVLTYLLYLTLRYPLATKSIANPQYSA